jgi:alkanesulfonate monooxygenase SsuD/methylene tetrahydromethanopterin reductase-like flavin-dependent oxidoreductase (luciferase family)
VSTGIAYGVYALPQVAPYQHVRAVAERAETIGFDSLWVADETPMAWPGLIEFEAWSVLAALARDTSRIRIGTLVSPPALRHPLLTAMAVTTVDHVSGGRVTLGMGVGGVPADLEGVGQGGIPNAELVDRLDEQLDTINRLLRGETVTRTAGFYPTKDAIVPRPLQQPRPPILVAAHGPRSLRVAARHADIWNTVAGEATHRNVELLDEACATIGRDPATIRRSVLSWRDGAFDSADALDDWLGRYRELGFTEFLFLLSGEPRKDEVLERRVADDHGSSHNGPGAAAGG